MVRAVALLLAMAITIPAAAQLTRRYLYVAVPGGGNESEYRGVGILVYDIDNGHTFVKRIPTWPVATGQQPEQVRGIAAHARTKRLFISTVKRLAAFDLVTDKIVWEKTHDGTCCDRLALSPDAATIYAPAFGAPKWYVIDVATGSLLATIECGSFAARPSRTPCSTAASPCFGLGTRTARHRKRPWRAPESSRIAARGGPDDRRPPSSEQQGLSRSSHLDRSRPKLHLAFLTCETRTRW